MLRAAERQRERVRRAFLRKLSELPGAGLAEIIATQVPGAQITTFYGGQIGANTSVDLRGFGPNSSQNLVVMVDGVRLSENELGGSVLSTIPLDTVVVTRRSG